MIKYYQRDLGQTYQNFLQVFFLWLRVEYTEILVALRIFDPLNLTYDTRRHVWALLLTLIAASIIVMFFLMGLSTLAIALTEVGFL